MTSMPCLFSFLGHAACSRASGTRGLCSFHLQELLVHFCRTPSCPLPCLYCAMRDCPSGSPDHDSPDGCPACRDFEQEAQSTATDYWSDDEEEEERVPALPPAPAGAAAGGGGSKK